MENNFNFYTKTKNRKQLQVIFDHQTAYPYAKKKSTSTKQALRICISHCIELQQILPLKMLMKAN